MSKKDAQAKAIMDYKEELYMKNVQSASEEYRKLKESWTRTRTTSMLASFE